MVVSAETFQSPYLQRTEREPVRGGISIAREVNIARQNERLSLNLREVSIRDVLNLIAQQGNFNLILDDSVTGTLTVDISNVDINKALEYIFSVSALSYTKDGDTLIVASQETASKKNLNARTFKAIPVLYKDATEISEQLNKTLFSIPRSGGYDKAVAAADKSTNSLLVMGTEEDISMVTQALHQLDVPRNRRVYRIKHNNPATIAQILAANFFGFGSDADGQGMAGQGAMGAMGGMGAMGAGGMQQQQQQGQGQQGAGGGIGMSLLPMVMPIVIPAGGVTFIAESNSQTLTVLGTEEQIALIDSVIDEIDTRRPQVSLEVALVEIQEGKDRALVPAFNNLSMGSYKLQILGDGGTNTLGWGGGPVLPNNFSLSKSASGSQPRLDRPFTINNQLKTTTGKILANPTIVALDGTTSEIDITDEVPTFNTTTSLSAGVAITATTITKEKAGITLSITPTITNDGSVTLNIKPTVSQPLRQVTADNVDGQVSTFLLSERSLDVGAVRVRDGDTLVIGGLLRETNSSEIDKFPGLADLPIVGAMFRAATRSSKIRTELVLMVTPHIIREDDVTLFKTQETHLHKEYFESHHRTAPMAPSIPRQMGKNGVPASAYTTVEPEKPETPTRAVPRQSQLPDREFRSERQADVSEDAPTATLMLGTDEEPSGKTPNNFREGSVLPPSRLKLSAPSKRGRDSDALPSSERGIPNGFEEVLR